MVNGGKLIGITEHIWRYRRVMAEANTVITGFECTNTHRERERERAKLSTSVCVCNIRRRSLLYSFTHLSTD